MAAFSDRYQEDIYDIIQCALQDGYDKKEVVILLSEIISYILAD